MLTSKGFMKLWEGFEPINKSSRGQNRPCQVGLAPLARAPNPPQRPHQGDPARVLHPTCQKYSSSIRYSDIPQNDVDNFWAITIEAGKLEHDTVT